MTGKDHFDRAELLAEQAYRLLGQGTSRRRPPGPRSVHATLALAAATGAGPGSSAVARPGQASAAATPPLRPDAVPDRNNPF